MSNFQRAFLFKKKALLIYRRATVFENPLYEINSSDCFTICTVLRFAGKIKVCIDEIDDFLWVNTVMEHKVWSMVIEHHCW
jgi:hypothetical protein